MLSSIHPLGERAKRQRWWITAMAYLAGSMLGGLAIGTAAWLAGAPVRAVTGSTGRAGLLAVAAVVAAAAEARPSWARWLPGLHRQVDDRWLTRYRGWVYGAGYGLQLGAAVLTIVTTAAIPLALVAAAVADPLWVAAGIGLAFGSVRGAALLSGRGTTDGERLRAQHRRLAARADRSRALARRGLGALAVVTVAGALAGWA